MPVFIQSIRFYLIFMYWAGTHRNEILTSALSGNSEHQIEYKSSQHFRRCKYATGLTEGQTRSRPVMSHFTRNERISTKVYNEYLCIHYKLKSPSSDTVTAFCHKQRHYVALSCSTWQGRCRTPRHWVNSTSFVLHATERHKTTYRRALCEFRLTELFQSRCFQFCKIVFFW